jgi:hypothetical protein
VCHTTTFLNTEGTLSEIIHKNEGHEDVIQGGRET